MSKKTLSKLGVFAILGLIALGVVFAHQENWTAMNAVIVIAAIAIVVVALAFAITLKKEGIFKEMAEEKTYKKQFRKDMHRIDQQMRVEEQIEKRYEPRIEELEQKRDALDYYLTKHGPNMSKDELAAKAAQYEELEKRIEALQEEQDREIEKALARIKK
jgi:DNA-binding cell septation regulator SpoVG